MPDWESKFINKIVLNNCLDLMREIPDGSVDLIITDPPWNVGKDYGTYKDDLSKKEYQQLIRDLKSEWDRIANGRVAIVLGSEILKDWWDVYVDAKIIIVKLGAIVLTRKNNMHLQWKAVVTTCNSNKFTTDNWEDIRWPGEGYYFDEPRYGHPAMTPLKLMGRLINLFSNENDLIFDPYMGVGTTAVAAMLLKRRYIGCEIDAKYLDTARKRIANTGLTTKEDRLDAGVPLTFEDLA